MNEHNEEWQPAATAPYETPVLTWSPGCQTRNSIVLINTKNAGDMLGQRDHWWHSKPNHQPTHWRPLPAPPTPETIAQQEQAAIDHVEAVKLGELMLVRFDQ